jgi:hypothetical protein
MVRYADNDFYLSIDGTVVSTYGVEITLERTNSSVETTSGAGVDHVMRAPGLSDTTITFSIAYDATALQTFIQKLQPGVVRAIEYGPENNVSGKPRHVQNFNITSSPFTTNVAKEMPVFEVSGEGTEAASVDLFTGAVYS